MSLSELKRAISAKMPVSFTYDKPGKTPGQRIGNPHVIFIMRKNDGIESTKVHIVQTDGVSDSGQDFPSFRMFNLEDLGEVMMIESGGKFDISDKYNAESDMYKFVICKI
jgi:hypothetical protein